MSSRTRWGGPVANAMGVLSVAAPAITLTAIFWPGSLRFWAGVITYAFAFLVAWGLWNSRTFRSASASFVLALFFAMGFAADATFGAGLVGFAALASALLHRSLRAPRLDIILPWTLLAVLLFTCATSLFLIFGMAGLLAFAIVVAASVASIILVMKAGKPRLGRRRLATEVARAWRADTAAAHGNEISVDEFRKER